MVRRVFTASRRYRSEVRSTLIAPAGLLLFALTACTPTGPAPSTAPTASAPTATADAGGPSPFPTCDEVAGALEGLLVELEFDADLSTAQTAPEDYAQRVCVFRTADGGAQIGVTFAAIPFQQSELEAYRGLPNSIADDRLAEHSAVLQTFQTDDGADGHLDRPLYLFDEQVSITIQGYAADGSSTLESLPTLTLAAATDAAFAARALVA